MRRLGLGIIEDELCRMALQGLGRGRGIAGKADNRPGDLDARLRNRAGLGVVDEAKQLFHLFGGISIPVAVEFG